MTEEIKVTVCRYPDRKNLVLRYVDPVTGKQKTKSAGTADEETAIGKAAVWQDELRSGRYAPPSRMTWADFRKRHEDEFQSGVAPETRDKFKTTFNLVERLMKPARLRDVTTEAVSRWIVALRDEGRKDSTVGLYMRHLRGAMNWAAAMGFVSVAPKIRPPKAETMKGRPIVLEEHERMLAAVPKVVGVVDAALWQRLLTGLWWSGLRLSEALALSWDSSEPIAVIMQVGYHPALRFKLGSQKAKRAELVPCAPEFAELLEAIPEAERHGRVFHVWLTPNQACRVVSAIGRRAGIVVDEATQKPATAHDYRRAFGTRWSKRVMPAVLRRLMRHKDIDTTLKYYVDQDAEDIAADLWKAYRQGNNPGNTQQENPIISAFPASSSRDR
jgi:integrase